MDDNGNFKITYIGSKQLSVKLEQIMESSKSKFELESLQASIRVWNSMTISQLPIFVYAKSPEYFMPGIRAGRWESMSEGMFDYKKNRLEEQIKWHSRKARENKKRFRMYKIITIFSSAIIPIVNVLGFAESSDSNSIFSVRCNRCNSCRSNSIGEVSRELDYVQDYFRTFEKGEILL